MGQYTQAARRSRPVHTETLFSVNANFASFWLIVHTDPVNALRVSGWKNPDLLPLRFHVDGESAYFPR